jgi:hypothetical protein
MEPDEVGKAVKRPAWKAGNTVKWGFVIGLATVAVVVGFFTIFRTPPAQSTVEKAFAMIEAGDPEGFMAYVDPEGQLGRLWNDNVQGARDRIISLLEQFRLEFSSLRFACRVEGEAAEVELKGGRVTVYYQGKEGPPAAFFDLGDTNLVFYVEKKGDAWLIEGVNYDIVEFLSGDTDFLPF